MEAKKRLAEILVTRFHGEKTGKDERAFFDETFSKKKLPEDIPNVSFPVGTLISEMILKSGVVKSKNEARRLISQGAIRMNGEKIPSDREVSQVQNFVLQVGKHHFMAVDLIDEPKSN